VTEGPIPVTSPYGQDDAGLPPPDAGFGEICDYIRDFDGYGVAGSFERCAAIAAAPDPGSVAEQKIALFFYLRAMRHSGDY